MGAEIGATTSLFAYDDAMARYLQVHRPRGHRRRRRRRRRTTCGPTTRSCADPGTLLRPGHRDRPRRRCEPLINGPHTPDLARPVADARRRGPAPRAGRSRSAPRWSARCTNSSYEDITRAASHRPPGRRPTACTAKTQLLITPGSEQVRATIERDGLLADFERIGATVLANACGPCIGQWARPTCDEGDANTIVTTYNRNFPKRNDGIASTRSPS